MNKKPEPSDIVLLGREIMKKVGVSTVPQISLVFQAMETSKLCTTTPVLFPASFNPPTKAHEEMVGFLNGMKMNVLLLLDMMNADKEIFGAPLEDRLYMMFLLCKRFRGVSLGISSHGRFIDKCKALEVLCKGRSDNAIFGVGFDTFARILEPRFYTDPRKELTNLFSRSGFIIFHRSGSQEEDIDALLESHSLSELAIDFQTATLSDNVSFLSSSLVRKTVKNKLSFSHMVQRDIEDYIINGNLYRDK